MAAILPPTDSKILGIVVFARHGDRRGFYQDPLTYTPAATSITPTGEQEEFALGTFLRATYLNPRSSSFIGTSTLFNQSQVQARADAGGEGGVIYDSAIALLQGLFPPTPDNRETLADGEVSVAPLGGYQYVPIESVEPNQDVSLEGFTSCPNLDAHTAAFYNSSDFLAVANASQPFLSKLPPYVDGRPVTLVNMWNIFDYMNVQSIHNATFARRLPKTFLAQARALANYHEYGVFSDSNFAGIGNIASRTVLPSILTAFQRIANASDPLKIHYSAISYKPFLSLFNMTGVADLHEVNGIVNYAATTVFEVRQSPTLGTVLRFKFKNGTDDSTLHTLNLKFPGWNGTGDVPLSTFISTFEPAAINTTTQWCNICGQTTARGCDQLKGVPGPAALNKRDDSSVVPSFVDFASTIMAPPSCATSDHYLPTTSTAMERGALALTIAILSFALGASMGMWFLKKAARTSREEQARIVVIERAPADQKSVSEFE